MRVSVCVGDYGKTPYCIPGLGMNVFSMEELCYCMKENAFLLDLSLLNDELLGWIEGECGLRELARALHPLVHKQGSLSALVTAILRYVGFYDRETVLEVERVLRQGAGLSGIEKRKRQVDSLVAKKRYKAALKGYDQLLEKWQETEGGVPAAGFLAAIWHNKGVASAGLMLYDSAAECFRRSFELSGDEESCLEYLAAMRMGLSRKDYLDFVSGHGELYDGTLELEKRFGQAAREWEEHPDYRRLRGRRKPQREKDWQNAREENEGMLHALKESYRKL